ncbi:signal recognition particle-docking protein FtsY [Pseudoflavonifractor phocaeensis]|uniref:signal recognition particle-docking protein FtsY n=1 Tax=Pseudoflavonifractor phocaeensis TaxID=1870988 RepID=UPI00313CBAB7
MGFFEKIKAGLTRTKENIGHSFDQLFAGELDDDFYDQLEETLILSDMGVDTALAASEALRQRAKEEKIKTAPEARDALKAILTDMLTVGRGELDLTSRPAVCLFIGVNGVGKTTTIGKLAAALKADGRRVLMAAGDTFRAAAADQLEIWSQRAGVDIVRQSEGADPAAVVFDALTAAKARNADVVLVDTAGRLHNKQNLMNELGKISRVIDRELPGASRETLLVLDATTGQNGLIQARQFKETAGLTGVVLTKLDGTAKGGIVVAIAQELGVPVKFIGVGEGVDDLMPFDAPQFVEALI